MNMMHFGSTIFFARIIFSHIFISGKIHCQTKGRVITTWETSSFLDLIDKIWMQQLGLLHYKLSGRSELSIFYVGKRSQRSPLTAHLLLWISVFFPYTWRGLKTKNLSLPSQIIFTRITLTKEMFYTVY